MIEVSILIMETSNALLCYTYSVLNGGKHALATQAVNQWYAKLALAVVEISAAELRCAPRQSSFFGTQRIMKIFNRMLVVFMAITHLNLAKI